MVTRHITTAKTHVFRDDDLKQVLHTGALATTFSKTKSKVFDMHLYCPSVTISGHHCDISTNDGCIDMIQHPEYLLLTTKLLPFLSFPSSVVITVGPACQSVEALCSLLEAGATCARVDLTWAPIEYHRISLQNLQEAMRRTRRLCAVILDTLGRDLMIKRKYGVDENGWPGIFEQISITSGQVVTITTDPAAECTNSVFPITYPKFPQMCQSGDSIFIGRYLVTGSEASSLFLEVSEVSDTEVICQAKNDAVLDGLLTVFHQERSEEGLANIQNDLPALTDFDRQAVAILASEFEIDFLSLSFCRSVDDVMEARDFLTSIGADHCKIIAKCETRQSLFNFRSIANSSDAILISRGNLGLDVVPEKMAMVQKAMISTATILGKPTVITRVVDTMIQTPRPTRAEATDIANAVLDGVDGIMLGAETYRGKYGLASVETVAAICREAEYAFDHNNHFEHLMAESDYILEMEDVDPEAPTRGKGASESLLRSRSMNEANLAASFAALPLVGAGLEASGPATYNNKLESIAASAVKTADKVGASLMVVLTHTGRAANMVARYRPPMPIMTLVVPYLKRDGLKWQLEGRSTARQALLTSGLMPVLAAPAPTSGETLIEEAVSLALKNDLIKADDHIVVVSRSAQDEFLIKVVTVDRKGCGIAKIRPKSLLQMLKAAGQHIPPDPDSPPSGKGEKVDLRRGSVLIGKGSLVGNNN